MQAYVCGYRVREKKRKQQKNLLVKQDFHEQRIIYLAL